MVVGVIGGGASGMAAALAAAENPSVSVLLLERQARLGRKLQATGNGRCNLTNLRMDPARYHGDDPAFSIPALSAFGPERTLAWFRTLGLFTTAEPGGRVYPYSDQANSVVDVLRFALNKPNIRVMTGFEVTDVKRTGAGFLIAGTGEKYSCDRLIVACGGLAGTRLGGSMAGYRLLEGLGHRCTRLRPSLVQLKTGWRGVVSLKGVRANCKAVLRRDGKTLAASTGEVQFTEYGLSGPVIFEISRDACQTGGEWTCTLDLLPETAESVLFDELCRRRRTGVPVEELLTGILHNRLGRVLTKAAGISGGGSAGALTDAQLRAVSRWVKDLSVPLTGTMGMDSAQVTAGGVRTGEFSPETMESRLVPGLYACGEVLDVDGDCGGYNLQWAWSSGRMAGLAAGGTAR